MTVKETDDLWRLYHREWTIVHTIDDVADEGRPVFEVARAWIKEHLTDRVREEDVQIELNSDGGSNYWAHVMLFKDNLKGEFKYVENAQLFANMQKYDEYVIVPRNSKSDHDIRAYGVVKL